MSSHQHKESFIKQATQRDNVKRVALPSDASLRKYERLMLDSSSLVLMDASEDKDSIQPFITVAEFLHAKGYSAPNIIAKAEDHGFILLEDLGEQSYSNLLNAAGSTLIELERQLYKRAIDVLVDIHGRVDVDEMNLKTYDEEKLTAESLLLLDWYLPSLHERLVSNELRQGYAQAWKQAFEALHHKASCLVLRDYHVDNLMWLDERVGIKKVGLLDFQDALIGSYAYDVVSLLEDARRTVTAAVVDEMINYYLDRMKTLDRRKFISDYKILGVQRACKIIGIFARKSVRDNDTRYLKHLPRVWGYVRHNIQHPMLLPVKLWFDKLKLDMMQT